MGCKSIEEACSIKRKVSPSELCEGLPEEFPLLLSYARKLTPRQVPNYSHFRRLFRNQLAAEGFENDGVYDWMIVVDSEDAPEAAELCDAAASESDSEEIESGSSALA